MVYCFRNPEDAGSGGNSEGTQDATHHRELPDARVPTPQQGVGRSLPREGPDSLQRGSGWVLQVRSRFLVLNGPF